VRELAADDGTISVERGERYFAPGERVMFDDLRMKIGNDLSAPETSPTSAMTGCSPL
jgi:hypothetical protein